jgi:hypothetical protein
MRKKIEKFIFRIILAGAAVAAYALTVGIYHRLFDIEWDEEVQLHDGRVIVVHVKHTYERLHKELGRYTSAITRDTEISFDSGRGKVHQLFKGYHPLLIDEYRGTWYAVIYGGDYYRSKEIPGQNWGEHWYDCNPAAILQGNQFKALPIYDLPTIFNKPNMLLLYGEASEHSQFAGRTVTLTEKKNWLKTHPPGYGDAEICRPPQNAVRPKILNPIQSRDAK